MPQYCELLRRLRDGGCDAALAALYTDAGLEKARTRTLTLAERCRETFGWGEDAAAAIFSAPGRTEIGGNHTDHQHGHGLAASVDLDTIACVCPNDTSVIRIKSRHHRMAEIDLNDLAVHPEEADRSVSLLRGVAARFRQLGDAVGSEMCIRDSPGRLRRLHHHPGAAGRRPQLLRRL